MKDGMIQTPDGIREWYCNGQLHRTDGPAVEYTNGTETDKWFLDDIKYSFKDWLRQNTELDKRTRMLYILRYSDEAACKTE